MRSFVTWLAIDLGLTALVTLAIAVPAIVMFGQAHAGLAIAIGVCLGQLVGGTVASMLIRDW
jgi:hypothetical protein